MDQQEEQMRPIMAAVAFLLVACGGGSDAVQPDRRPVAALLVAAGDNQTDTVARQLPVAVTLQAKDALGGPVPFVVLNWYATTHEGENCVGCADTIFVGASATDAGGGAKYLWTLRSRAGQQGLIAWAIGSEGERVVHVKALATAVADRAVSIMVDHPVVAPDGFVAIADHAWASDQYGNFAGTPRYDVPPAGWRVSGDTAYAPSQTGEYALPIIRDAVRTTLTVRVQ